jgi:PAS domain S-box-containing protein
VQPHLAEILHPDDVEMARHTLERAIEERGALDAEARLLPRDGETRHVRVRGRVECDEGGAPVRLVGTTQDITESKATQAELAEQLAFQQREHQIARSLYEQADIESITTTVFEGLRELFDAEVGLVSLTTADGTHTEGVYEVGFGGAPAHEIRFDLDAAGFFSHVTRTGEPLCLFVTHAETDPPQSIERHYNLNGPAAFLPLRVRGRTVGVLGILRQQEGVERPPFTAEDVERMTPLVTDLAVAIENARLYEQVREHVRSLEHVVSSARCLLWHGEVDEIDGAPVWNFAPVSEEAAQNVFPVDVPPGEQWHSVVGSARLPEDNDRMNAMAFDAFGSDVRSYSQDYRATDKHGKIHWLHEDVAIEPLSPGRWLVTGVTSDVTERRQAEEEVRRSEEHFRRIFEHGPLGMAIVGVDFALMDVNDTLATMLGYTREEMLALSIQAVTHPDDFDSDLELGAQVMQGDIPSYSIEKRYLRKDGEIVWGRLTGSAVHDANGAPLYGIEMVENITGQKRDELVRQSLHDISEAVHTTPDLPTMCDRIYHSLTPLIDAPGFAIALTVEGEPDTFDTVYLVEDGQVAPGRRAAVPRTRTAHVARTRAPLCLTRTESVRMGESGEIDPGVEEPRAYLGVPLELGDELIGVVLAWHDEEEAPYTERHTDILSFAAEQIAVAIDRRRTEEDLIHERNLFQALMETSPDAIYFKDAERRFTRVSTACAEGMALTDPAAAVGKTDRDLHTDPAVDDLMRQEQRILDTGEPLVGFLSEHTDPDGAPAWDLVSKSATRDADGRITGLVGINREVTDLMRIQEALRASETGRTQLMERMITVQEEERARIARELHDQVGQELTSVLLGLRIVEAAPSVEAARRQIAELRDVTANTLEDVRQIAFEMRPSSLEDLGVGPALQRDVTIMGQGAKFTPTFRFYNPDDLPLTTAVELGIYRIVHSALTNIVRHARAENVNVTVLVEPREVSVLVQDDGVGFDAEAVMTGPVEGRFGILSMEERAKIVGGRVSVDSEPGVGTSILAQMPRADDDDDLAPN